ISSATCCGLPRLQAGDWATAVETPQSSGSAANTTRWIPQRIALPRLAAAFFRARIEVSKKVADGRELVLDLLRNHHVEGFLGGDDDLNDIEVVSLQIVAQAGRRDNPSRRHLEDFRQHKPRAGTAICRDARRRNAKPHRCCGE